MPVVHIYTAEGWVSPRRKQMMIEKVTDAVVAAEGREEVRAMTYVLVHDVGDGGGGVGDSSRARHGVWTWEVLWCRF